VKKSCAWMAHGIFSLVQSWHSFLHPHVSCFLALHSACRSHRSAMVIDRFVRRTRWDGFVFAHIGAYGGSGRIGLLMGVSSWFLSLCRFFCLVQKRLWTCVLVVDGG
jgi:hypothetical protein